MSLPPLDPLYIISAALPLIVVLYLMIFRNWGGSRAGPAGWLTAIVVAVLVFGADLALILVAFGRSLLLAFFVLYIIWMALLLYHVVNDAGAIDVIGQELPGLAQDQPGQALLLGWVFGSFLQGASGFGVPAAVVAPLLVGLGFAANPAVVIALVGHAWAVTFGSLGSSFFSLIAATNQPGDLLAAPSAALLGLSCLLCGLAVLWESGRLEAVRRRWLQLWGIGLLMAAVQFSLAVAGLWSLAAFGAGLAGLLAIVIDLRFAILDPSAWNRRLRRKQQLNFQETDKGTNNPEANRAQKDDANKSDKEGVRQGTTNLNWTLLGKAMMPYLILTIIIVLGQLALEGPLSVLTLNLGFPAVETRFGWATAAGPGRSISLLGHAGALLLYTSVLSFMWFRWRGTFKNVEAYKGSQIVRKTIRGSTNSTIGIITLVAMAITMQHAGMTQMLALALSAGTGGLFPFLSPFIGALGAFMTGSNTNSNVVFGQLQMETALTLGIPITLILAAQTSGGAIGSLFAPAKVLVGCSTVKGAQDGQVLKKATIYGLGIVAVLGLVAWALVVIG